MSRPIRATIHLSALSHNLDVARHHATHARVLAVIKANGYGHGMLRVARALAAADGFAVLNVQEAVTLREAGFTQEILLLEGFFTADELPLLTQHRIATVVHAQWQIDALLRFSSAVNIPLWLKANSGMNRLGFQASEFPAALDALQHAGATPTLMTHFARADESEGIAGQLTCFNAISRHAELPRSMANSAALLSYPQTHADWVRPGIMLYGASPLPPQSAAELGLHPAMTLSSEVIALRNIKAGDEVGYGGTFQAPCDMRIGVVACGYADGYPRHAPTGTPLLVNGQRSRVIGRVSMDMLTVDLSNIPEANVGTPVTLWGEGMPVEDVAAAAGTISYELLCAVAQRVPMLEAA
ncbi:alanine racemase, catabolic [Sulfurimicrobium lacus]|uniref:Alanine racemase n=1 Tax=Sulfurimicrobium lacus TaxID=2715678 RepID=A0A6F8VBC6_9PROT|nr:alanine racemase [Sulfurimicrobium lacus]BCB26964.1 alanine racemase, catabolic [Sulfurimicrobium lacus]